MSSDRTGGVESEADPAAEIPDPENPDLVVRRVAGTGVPVRGDDIDTDQIIPARFLKTTTWDGLGEYAFHDARYDDDGEPTDHPFNEYRGANVLVVNANFGCGSSREHAPRALRRWGVDAIVGESFAEIFADNCRSLGLPAVTAPPRAIETLQDFIEDNPQAGIEVDVARKRVTYADTSIPVDMDRASREALLKGIWDTTTLLRSNLDRVHKVATELPYIDG